MKGGNELSVLDLQNLKQFRCLANRSGCLEEVVDAFDEALDCSDPPHVVLSPPNHCLCPAAEVFERNASQSLDLMASGFPIRLLMTGGAQTR